MGGGYDQLFIDLTFDKSLWGNFSRLTSVYDVKVFAHCVATENIETFSKFAKADEKNVSELRFLPVHRSFTCVTRCTWFGHALRPYARD